ncbi:hypothetical protein PG994_009674 [Apiospora phragmitis]|uniref:Uncharacterized protein n=1 Tax=Apiospora phragmitis TaxID=2905665 RepID=A0ABR1U7C1_9PEZI
MLRSQTVAILEAIQGNKGPGLAASQTSAVEGDAVGWPVPLPEPERSDFIEPKNVLDSDMKDAVAQLERQGDETRERFRREHGQESWFAA